MEKLARIPTGKKDLEHCNIVCKWIKVHYLSEITTADINFIDTNSWLGNPVIQPNTLWSYQEQINYNYTQT